MYNLHKPFQRICSRIVRLLGLKHHVILVLFSGQLRPLVADFGFFLRFIVVQVVALGLYHQNLPTVEHHDDVGIGVNGPVNLEAQSGNIPVPPLDVAQLRQCPHHLELVLVHIFFGGIHVQPGLKFHSEVVFPDNEPLKPSFHQGLAEGL